MDLNSDDGLGLPQSTTVRFAAGLKSKRAPKFLRAFARRVHLLAVSLHGHHRPQQHSGCASHRSQRDKVDPAGGDDSLIGRGEAAAPRRRFGRPSVMAFHFHAHTVLIRRQPRCPGPWMESWKPNPRTSLALHDVEKRRYYTTVSCPVRLHEISSSSLPRNSLARTSHIPTPLSLTHSKASRWNISLVKKEELEVSMDRDWRIFASFNGPSVTI